jgi:uncharacterized protein
MSFLPDRPLNDIECDRMDAILSRFHGEHAMQSAEEVDGFFAALICSPEIAKPSEYSAEILGETANDEAFADDQELREFLGLLMRHWNSIGRKLEDGDFTPLLFVDESGTAHGNDWARGFMRGVDFHHADWEELFVDELYSPLIPILALAYEHDPDPEMRPYKDVIDAERRERLIIGAAAGAAAIYEYFGPERRRRAVELAAERRPAEQKNGRNDPCDCGSGKKYKHCCGKVAG